MNIPDNTPPRFQKNDFVVLDLEIFGAEEKKLHRPTGEFALCTFTHGNIVWIADTVGKFVEFYKAIGPDPVLVFHNAKFDITQLRRWVNIPPRPIWDTMLIEKLLWSGYYDRFALGDLTRRYLDHYMDKSVRDTFEKATEVTPEQIQYAAEDGFYTYQVLQEQIKLVKGGRKDVFKVWKEIDMPALWAFMDFQGSRLDIVEWENLAKSNEERAETLNALFDFNPRSPKQVVAALKNAGFPRLPNSQAETIENFIRRYPNTPAAEIATTLLEYRGVQKLASTYGMNFIDNYVEPENDYFVIFADYHVIGAETGRTSCSSPNKQNIPARKYPEFRKPWIARPGNKLIVMDYSSQEPRIAAFLSQDKVLMEIFNSGNDPYIETARVVHDREITKDDPFRNDMKIDFLAATYGQQPIDDDHAERLNKFFKTFPDLYVWYSNQKKKKNYVETVSGRRIWLNPYSTQCERNSLNAPIQGTAADMMKKSIATIHQEWKWDCPFGIIDQIHDEAIEDVPEKLAQEIANWSQDILEQVGREMCPGVPFKASAKVVNSWYEGK